MNSTFEKILDIVLSLSGSAIVKKAEEYLDLSIREFAVMAVVQSVRLPCTRLPAETNLKGHRTAKDRGS